MHLILHSHAKKMTLYGDNILSSVYLASKADAITSRWLCPLSDISKLSPLPCNNHHGDGDWKSTSSTESATQNLASARSLYWTRLSVVNNHGSYRIELNDKFRLTEVLQSLYRNFSNIGRCILLENNNNKIRYQNKI